MKKLMMSVLTFGACLSLSAQQNVGQFLRFGKHDATLLTKAYLQPYGEMLGTNLNAGWYNSAAVHKIGGFDFTIMGVWSMVPSSKTTYDVKDLDLQEFELQSGSPSIAPNMAGEMNENDLPTLIDRKSSIPLSLTLPNGNDVTYMLSPMLQAAVGLPFKTELTVRYMPEVKLGDWGKTGLWGVGLKHNIDHYIPVLSKVPFFNITWMGAYTKFNGSLTLPDNSVLNDGELNMESGAFTTRLLLGANLPVVALYTGVGYGSTSSDFDINGSFNGGDNGNIIALNYKNTGFNFNAGMRIRLGVLAFHGDYTVGEYSSITAGVGLSFR